MTAAATDWSIGKAARLCAATGRELKAGDVCHSALREGPDGFTRLDYGEESWAGVPRDTLFSYWKTRIPDASRPHRRPTIDTEALYALFHDLAASGNPSRACLQGVVALLLTRRRVFRLDGISRRPPEEGGDLLRLHDRRNNRGAEAPVPGDDPQAVARAEEELRALLEM